MMLLRERSKGGHDIYIYKYIYVCVHGATKDEGERKRALEDGGEEEKEKEEEKSGKG